MADFMKGDAVQCFQPIKGFPPTPWRAVVQSSVGATRVSVLPEGVSDPVTVNVGSISHAAPGKKGHAF